MISFFAILCYNIFYNIKTREEIYMALIKCPECGKEVSDKSKVCIHCGYPFTNTECVIDGKSYDLSNAMNLILSGDFIKGIKEIRLKTSLGLQEARDLADIIRSSKEIPRTFTFTPQPDTDEILENYTNQQSVTCPYCHSTDVKKITVGSKALHTAVFGLLSMGRNSKQWHCNNCKSDF